MPRAGADESAVELLTASAAPQSPQNRLSAGLSAPHCEQRETSDAPQSPQNFLPIALSAPQFEHNIVRFYLRVLFASADNADTVISQGEGCSGVLRSPRMSLTSCTVADNAELGKSALPFLR